MKCASAARSNLTGAAFVYAAVSAAARRATRPRLRRIMYRREPTAVSRGPRPCAFSLKYMLMLSRWAKQNSRTEYQAGGTGGPRIGVALAFRRRIRFALGRRLYRRRIRARWSGQPLRFIGRLYRLLAGNFSARHRRELHEDSWRTIALKTARPARFARRAKRAKRAEGISSCVGLARATIHRALETGRLFA